jgi:hypothetical protein
MASTGTRYELQFKMGPGWSEIFYTQESGSPRSLIATGQALAAARLKCLVAAATLHHVRISSVGVSTPSYNFPIFPSRGGLIQNNDVPGVTSNYGIYSATGQRRTLQLHGLPDSDHVYDAAGDASITLAGYEITFLSYLVSRGFCIRSVAVRANTLTPLKIANITIAGPVQTVTVDTTGLVVGQKVRISGAQGFKSRQWNAVVKVASLIAGPPTQFTFGTKRLIDPNATYVTGSAQLRNADIAGFNFLPITVYDNFSANGTRRVGRPTDLPRGKQSLKR